MTISPDRAKMLRAPFAPEQIGKLPKPTKRDNPKGKCKDCGGYHGLPAVHLDYVGHAAITDRLLQVDPEWSWKPMGVDERGLPLLDPKGGLWIWLTICGVTRPGYGDETNGKGMKEIIGDALRNGAMRFGVGLDLWSKEDLRAGDEARNEDRGGADGDGADGTAAAPKVITAAQRTRLFTVATAGSVPEDRVRELVKSVAGVESSKDIPRDKYDALVAAVEAEKVAA